MTEEDRQHSNEITKKINKIDRVTNLCDFKIFSKYTLNDIKAELNEVSNDDILYILWNWGKSDEFIKDVKWSNVVKEYIKEYTALIKITEHNNEFIRDYIKVQCKILQDCSLELMLIHKDYNNEDLKGTIDKTNNIIN